MGVSSLPGKKRRQMPGVCPGGMLKLRFGWYISEMFIFILFGGWSVEGSVGVVREPVHSGGPWTGGQCFRVTPNNMKCTVVML